VAATGFAALAVFQTALALGAPLGHAAWGGENADISTVQRYASAVAAVVYVAAALIVLCRGGVIWHERSGAALVRWGTWSLAAAMALGAVPNLLSQSRWENLLFGPLALALAVLSALVARGARQRNEARSSDGNLRPKVRARTARKRPQ
jgi:hypothetical protein